MKGGTVMTLAAQGTLDGADVLIADGKVAAVGKNLAAPEGARVVDARGKVVFPAFFQARSALSLRGARGDDTNSLTRPVAPDLDAFFAVDSFHRSFFEVRRSGLGAAFVAPGDSNLIGGMGLVLKTRGRTAEDMTLKRRAAMVMSFGETPKAIYGEKRRAPSTRMGAAALLREAFIKAQAYQERVDHYEKKLKETKAGDKPPKKPDTDFGHEALLAVLRGEMPVMATAHRMSDIEAVLRLADEFGFRVILEGATDAHLVAGELARRKIPVVFGPMRSSWRSMERMNHTPEAPAILERAGVAVALRADEGGMYGPEGVRELPLDAAFAARHGMSEAAALRAMALAGAQMLGVADRIGSIEVGKDADLVILSGHPFRLRSLPETLILDGKVAWP